MPALSLLKVSGDDAESFLQGQLTNDVTQLHERWQFNAMCNPKGRALAVFLCWHQHDSFCLLTDASLIDSVSKRLQMYVLRSKVTITVDRSITVSTNATKDSPLYFATASATSTQLGLGSALLEVAEGGADAANPEHAEAADWAALFVSLGLPMLSDQHQEMFIPQMLNLDILDGISFKKGCYTGQEIVARMRYLGKVKQRMFTIECSSKPAVGDKVFDHSEKAIGEIILPSARAALAVLRVDSLKHASLLQDTNGSPIHLSNPQAYEIDN